MRSPVRTTGSIFFETNEGNVELLMEVIDPPPPLVVFAAGWDAVPVMEAGKGLGWHVTFVDHRGGYATKEQIAHADARVVGKSSEVWDAINITPQTAVVVMTHDYTMDVEILASLLVRPIGYLGVLGPRSRTNRLLAELREQGRKITSEFVDALHAPIGLALGAETPQEVALAIVSEVLAWRTGSGGGFLRDHNGPIHRAIAEPPPVIAAQNNQEALA